MTNLRQGWLRRHRRAQVPAWRGVELLARSMRLISGIEWRIGSRRWLRRIAASADFALLTCRTTCKRIRMPHLRLMLQRSPIRPGLVRMRRCATTHRSPASPVRLHRHRSPRDRRRFSTRSSAAPSTGSGIRAIPTTGLTPDRWPTQSFSSVAAIGFALTAYPVGVERGYVPRADAAQRVLNTLRFMYTAPQGSQPADVTGYKGFFYHFLDMQTGRRFQQVELSTIDTSLLLARSSVLPVVFHGRRRDRERDSRVRRFHLSASRLAMGGAQRARSSAWVGIRRPDSSNSDWQGLRRGDDRLHPRARLAHPFHRCRIVGRVDAELRCGSRSTDRPFVSFAPLFGHQYSHVWIDFRGIQDAYMRGKGIDYFENSRRATYSQRAYAIDNPGHWQDYGANVWGLTADDGPHDTTVVIDGVKSAEFHTYTARGAAADYVTDDGTIGRLRPGGSVPFAPEIAIPALVAMREKYGDNLFTNLWFCRFIQSDVPVADHAASRARRAWSGLVRHRLSGNRSGADHRDDRELSQSI